VAAAFKFLNLDAMFTRRLFEYACDCFSSRHRHLLRRAENWLKNCVASSFVAQKRTILPFHHTRQGCSLGQAYSTPVNLASSCIIAPPHGPCWSGSGAEDTWSARQQEPWRGAKYRIKFKKDCAAPRHCASHLLSENVELLRLRC